MTCICQALCHLTSHCFPEDNDEEDMDGHGNAMPTLVRSLLQALTAMTISGRKCENGHLAPASIAWEKALCDICGHNIASGDQIAECEICPTKQRGCGHTMWWCCTDCLLEHVPQDRMMSMKHMLRMPSHRKSKKNVPKEVDFREIYELGKKLGSGAYSVVKIGTCKKTGTRHAVKCISRPSLSEEDVGFIKMEVSILKKLHHPNIMRLDGFYDDEKFFYLVTELADGGDLFDKIVEDKEYNECGARDLIKLVVESVSYCHHHQIVHRDLKPENLLLTHDHKDIKLADFGFAKQTDMTKRNLHTVCGTPGFAAPEILKSLPYGPAVDVYALGVITYMILCGYPPYAGDSQFELFEKVKRGKLKFPSPDWDDVSKPAKKFIRSAMSVDPDKRPTSDDLRDHEWITKMSKEELESHHLDHALQLTRGFTARRKFKAAVRTVVAVTRVQRLVTAARTAKATLEDDESEKPARVRFADEDVDKKNLEEVASLTPPSSSRPLAERAESGRDLSGRNLTGSSRNLTGSPASQSRSTGTRKYCQRQSSRDLGVDCAPTQADKVAIAAAAKERARRVGGPAEVQRVSKLTPRSQQRYIYGGGVTPQPQTQNNFLITTIKTPDWQRRTLADQEPGTTTANQDMLNRVRDNQSSNAPRTQQALANLKCASQTSQIDPVPEAAAEYTYGSGEEYYTSEEEYTDEEYEGEYEEYEEPAQPTVTAIPPPPPQTNQRPQIPMEALLTTVVVPHRATTGGTGSGVSAERPRPQSKGERIFV